MPKTKKPVKLKLLPDMGGGIQAVYMRQDIGDGDLMAHSIARAMPKKAFEVASHWPCTICEDHAFTPDDFHRQWDAAVEALRTP